MGAYASVAQLDRASDSDSEGRGFESRQVHHEIFSIIRRLTKFGRRIYFFNHPVF